MTLKELIRWAYALQLVHLRDVAPDRDRKHLTGTVCDSAHRVAARADMGVGYGTLPAIALSFHVDAEAVHDAVLALGPIDSRLVIEYGCTGQHPEPMVSVPRPQPFLPNIGSQWERPEVYERTGQGDWRGEEMRYRITADETVVERRPIYHRVGRRKMSQIGEEEVRTPVEYCPIYWWPDPRYVEAVNGIAERWGGIMERLGEALAEVGLAAHEIVAAAR